MQTVDRGHDPPESPSNCGIRGRTLSYSERLADHSDELTTMELGLPSEEPGAQ